MEEVILARADRDDAHTHACTHTHTHTHTHPSAQIYAWKGLKRQRTLGVRC